MRFLVVAFLLGSMLYAAHIDEYATKMGFERQYAKGLQQAKEQGLKLLVMITKEQCGWCRRFEKRTLKDQEVQKLLDQKFVVVVLDKYHDKGEYPSEKLKAPFTPKSFVVDPTSERVLKEFNGYVAKDDFIQRLEK